MKFTQNGTCRITGIHYKDKIACWGCFKVFVTRGASCGIVDSGNGW